MSTRCRTPSILLLEAHPVLTARLERGADGRHQLVADDLLHSGIEVVEVDGPDD